MSDLSLNQLPPAGTFLGLIQLQTLSLKSPGHNSYDRVNLPPGIFQGLGNVKNLDLCRQGTLVLLEGSFEGLSGLEELDLNC
eukprot:1133688-Rhodomonas_salina.1